MMMPDAWCGPSSGRQANFGSADSATFIRKVAEAHL